VKKFSRCGLVAGGGRKSLFWLEFLLGLHVDGWSFMPVNNVGL